MTIKPVSAPPSAKRVAGNVVDADNKETQVVVVVEQSVASQAQSPQRRGEVYDELARTHRCSPHKSNARSKRRDHHDSHGHHHKRDRLEREKLNHPAVVAGSGGASGGVSGSKCNSPPSTSTSSGSSSPSVGRNSPEHLGLGCSTVPTAQGQLAPPTVATANLLKSSEDAFSGYNSGDEHLQPKEHNISAEEWQRRDVEFSKCMDQRGYELKPVEEDGACLFRSISLQIYGDEEMHDVIRQHTMDYIHENREYFGQFVTEDINSYIQRKRARDAHGNHIEIQAISEIYSRTVEVYCYQSTPINIFNSEQSQAGYPPLRLSYQRGSHYNAILDPYNATVGVGLGLAGYKPEIQTAEAVRLSEQLEIEQTMFEDKLKTTDWEATNEAIEEQIARESYLQWCRDNMQRSRSSNTAAGSATSSTVTSAEALTDSDASPSKYSMCGGTGSSGNPAATLTSSSGAVDPTVAAFSLSPKTLSQFSHKLASDDIGGYDSDTTDMSSTSSVGHCGGNSSPSTVSTTGQRTGKGSKTQRRATALRKKRRHEAREVPLAGKSTDILEAPLRKSPKRDSAPSVARANTPDAEQRPCTSKQSSISPQKRGEGQSSSQQNYSSFYQELLEASYANEGVNESEMLQQAIQMSTRDYMEDQKRKYLSGP
ncbi:OTU domain-containing protein 5-B [Drosophila serrata]|uniref:OTU domain-containing protein 5-B n=1 Tax=Drosophila serrata TaxID=7274 RepID=UPI000A1D261B|nr:OTU domain-containing protein 5-B [Drosophila serrata]XP_020804633.1 OTU domain-containing protein 5-B [Drosophila serrata]XP_020804635.1 OTU domain-containing protein 5-B [Drosophila serrata]